MVCSRRMPPPSPSNENPSRPITHPPFISSSRCYYRPPGVPVEQEVDAGEEVDEEEEHEEEDGQGEEEEEQEVEEEDGLEEVEEDQEDKDEDGQEEEEEYMEEKTGSDQVGECEQTTTMIPATADVATASSNWDIPITKPDDSMIYRIVV